MTSHFRLQLQHPYPGGDLPLSRRHQRNLLRPHGLRPKPSKTCGDHDSTTYSSQTKKTQGEMQLDIGFIELK